MELVFYKVRLGKEMQNRLRFRKLSKYSYLLVDVEK